VIAQQPASRVTAEYRGFERLDADDDPAAPARGGVIQALGVWN